MRDTRASIARERPSDSVERMTIDTSALGGASIKTLDDSDVALSSLWRDGHVVIAFVRHFG
jgi:hypothetical protein